MKRNFTKDEVLWSNGVLEGDEEFTDLCSLSAYEDYAFHGRSLSSFPENLIFKFLSIIFFISLYLSSDYIVYHCNDLILHGVMIFEFSRVYYYYFSVPVKTCKLQDFFMMS